MAKQICALVRSAWEKPALRPALTKLFRELDSGALDQEWVYGWERVAAVLGHHPHSFPRWVRKYPDAPRPRQNGQHNLPAWRVFLDAHKEIRSDDDADLAGLRLELEREKVRELKRLNDEQDGLLWPSARVLAWASRLGSKVHELCQRRHQELGSKCEGLRAAQISAHIASSDAKLLELFNGLKGGPPAE